MENKTVQRASGTIRSNEERAPEHRGSGPRALVSIISEPCVIGQESQFFISEVGIMPPALLTSTGAYKYQILNVHEKGSQVAKYLQINVLIRKLGTRAESDGKVAYERCIYTVVHVT